MDKNSDISLSDLSVEKKSGKREKFSTEKLLTGISRGWNSIFDS